MSDSEKLLTTEEQDVCQKIAASDAGLAGQRAAALLALDQEATRAQASEQTGLTVGQVGYLLRTFRQKRLTMFPDAESSEEQPPPEVVEPEKESKEKKKGKKPKRGKKAKRKAKPKKSKKAKAKKGKAAKKKSKKK